MSPQSMLLSGTIVREEPGPGGTRTYLPVAHVRVTAYGAVTQGCRGAVLASTRTGADGRFAFHDLREPVTLEVVPPSTPGLWQAGWFYPEYASTDPTIPSFVQFYRNPPTESTVPPDADLGRIALMPATAEGLVVCDRAPVAGALVRYRPPGNRAPGEQARTDRHGRYRVQDLSYDEFLVLVSADGMTGGYVGADGRVFETAGEACTFAPGPFPYTIHLHRLPGRGSLETSALLGDPAAPSPVG